MSTTQFYKDKEAVEALTNARALTEEDKALVAEIYTRAYKENLPNCNCADKYSDALVKLSIYYRNHSEYIVSAYTMPRGVVFLLDGVAYTAANLTDEVAERLLGENEQAKKFISKIEQKVKKKAVAKKKQPAETAKTVEKEG